MLKPEIFEILLALSEGPLHGYGIVQSVAQASEGRVRLAPSLLYRRLRRLMEEGLVEEAGQRPGERGEPRRDYRLTARGRRLLAAESRRLVGLAGDERIRRLAAEASE